LRNLEKHPEPKTQLQPWVGPGAQPVEWHLHDINTSCLKPVDRIAAFLWE
jgi:hypothetical protein